VVMKPQARSLVFQAACWRREPVTSPLTPQWLSALLADAAAAPEETDVRCEIRCVDGFSLRLYRVGDEGFESDDEAAAGVDERGEEELRVSDHALRSKPVMEEDSSSANSSCSDTDERGGASPPAPASDGWDQVIEATDILFCHTEPAVPCGLVFVVRQPAPCRDAALQAILLRCARETVAAELYTAYHELTRRLKWERYTSAKRKSDISRASFRNVNDSLRLRSAGRFEEEGVRSAPLSLPPELQSHASSPALREDSGPLSQESYPLRVDSGPHSLPQVSEISRILSLSTPEVCWQRAPSADGRRRTSEEEQTSGSRTRQRGSTTPTRYIHNKGPAPPVPPPRKHPTNPNLLLVPTKNGREPYRVVTGESRPPLLLYAAEFPQHGTGRAELWGHKMSQPSQFDANNNRSRPPGRQQLYWLPAGVGPEAAVWGGGGGGRRPEQRPRARSKSPAGRHRGFELPGALSQALKGLTSHLKREAPPPPSTPANPKSVMKKRDKASASPESKRVTFSAYSTVQVMD